MYVHLLVIILHSILVFPNIYFCLRGVLINMGVWVFFCRHFKILHLIALYFWDPRNVYSIVLKHSQTFSDVKKIRYKIPLLLYKTVWDPIVSHKSLSNHNLWIQWNSWIKQRQVIKNQHTALCTVGLYMLLARTKKYSLVVSGGQNTDVQ